MPKGDQDPSVPATDPSLIGDPRVPLQCRITTVALHRRPLAPSHTGVMAHRIQVIRRSLRAASLAPIQLNGYSAADSV